MRIINYTSNGAVYYCECPHGIRFKSQNMLDLSGHCSACDEEDSLRRHAFALEKAERAVDQSWERFR